MKLIVALAAGAAAFTGPVTRLPAGRVGHVTKAQQPAMLLGGLRARANKALVSYGVRDVAIKQQRGASRVKPLKPRSARTRTKRSPLYAIDATRSHSQVATKAEAAEVSTTEKKDFLGGLDVPLLAYFFFWYLGNYYCPATASETFESRGVVSVRRRRDAPSQTISRTRRPSRPRAAPWATP